MLSIISMLSSPNDESPANIDAAKMWRDDYAGFKKRVARCVRKSQEECFKLRREARNERKKKRVKSKRR